MNSLDQVFIKAYSKDSSSTTAPSTTAPAGRSVHPSPQPTYAQHARPPVHADNPYGQQSRYRPDRPSSPIPQPHASSSHSGDDEARSLHDAMSPASTTDLLDDTVARTNLPSAGVSENDFPSDVSIDGGLSTTALVMPPFMPIADSLTVPSESVPSETVPSETVPSETVPSETEPSVSPPAAPTDSEPTHPETTSEVPVDEPVEPSLDEEPPQIEHDQCDNVVADNDSIHSATTDVTSVIAPDEHPSETPPTAEIDTSSLELTAANQAEQAKSDRASKGFQLGASVVPAPHFPASRVRLKNREFQPVWEVNRFDWPRLCRQLTDQYGEHIAAAGERLHAAAVEGRNVVAVTSLSRGAGCTTLALCLARWASGAGLRVALIDADMERPQLDVQLGLQAPDGWRHATDGELPFHETAVTSLQDRLALVPLRPARPLMNGSLCDDRMSNILRQASELFELVVVDVGPVDVGDLHSAKNSDHCPIDTAVVVHDTRRTEAERLDSVVALLHHVGVTEVFIAENFAAPDAARHETLETALP